MQIEFTPGAQKQLINRKNQIILVSFDVLMGAVRDQTPTFSILSNLL